MKRREEKRGYDRSGVYFESNDCSTGITHIDILRLTALSTVDKTTSVHRLLAADLTVNALRYEC
jgi:hypothetical protein